MQTYRKARPLKVDGIKLLMFVDYSQELYSKKGAFAQLCAHLHSKKVKFTLVYQAILHLQIPKEDHKSFTTQRESELYLEAVQLPHQEISSPRHQPLTQAKTVHLSQKPRTHQRKKKESMQLLKVLTAERT